MDNIHEPHPVVTLNPYQFNDSDISDVADAMNFLLSALHCPRSVRPLMHALMGFLAGRKTKASFYHFDLARRMDKLEYIENADEFARYKAAAVSRVRAAIDKMKKWNDEWDGLNIDYTPGGRKQSGELFPSAIQTPLLSWVSDIANEVRAIEGFTHFTERKRAEAFRKAIGEMLKKKRVLRRKKAVKRCKKEMSYDQILKMTATMGSKYLAKLQEEGREPTPELINSIAIYLADIWKNEFVGVGYELHHHPDAEETPATEDLQDYSNESVVPENLASTHTNESQAGGICAPVTHSVVSGHIEDTPELQELDAFMSVGVDDFDMLLRDDTKPKREAMRRSLKGVTAGEVPCQLPQWKAQADKHKWSLVITPVAENVQMIDDVEPELVSILKPYAFLVKETSPDNHQVYVAFRDGDDKASAGPRLIDGLRQMFPKSGLNAGSGGATRWAGSRNYKPSRRQPDGTYPTVTIHSIQPGRYVTPGELDAVGMLAPEREASSTNDAQADYRMTGRWMPDYDRCLKDAPLKADGSGPDESRADASFVSTGLKAGQTRRAMEAALWKVSRHAREDEPEDYVTRTVQRVAAYLERENGRQYV